MKTAFSEILGGLAVIALATLLGVVVNAVRSGGVPLIQGGAPVSTAGHGAADGAADTSGTPALPEGAVSLQEMKRIYDEGVAYIIDARDPVEFDQGHIPGAINIPHDRLPEYLDMLSAEVPMNAQVVIYCRGPDCDFSDKLATELKILGYQNVSVFPGGWEQWSEAGYPIDGMVPK